MSTRKRAGVYGRQSQGKQTSVDDQLRAGRARCAALNAGVAWEGRDKVSASRFGTEEREDWPVLLAKVAAGELDLVWLWDASRGDRTPETWFAFLSRCREHGVLIYSERDERTYNVQVPRDWKNLADDGVNNAYDSEIKSVDVRRGTTGAAVSGKAHGLTPSGYMRVYDPHDRKVFTQTPNEDAPVRAEIIKRVAALDPISEIVRDLNNRGLRATRGGPWAHDGVLKIARNPAYAGLRSHYGTLYPGNWPAIVSESVWRAAQAVLDDPSRKQFAPGSYRWLLSFLAVGQCGGSLQGTLGGSPSRGGRRNRYNCDRDSCASIGEWELDEYVTRLACGWFARKGARRLFERQDEGMKAARAALLELTAELEEWRTSADTPHGISANALARKERALAPLIEAAQKRIVKATAPTAAMALLTAADVEKALIRPTWDGLSIVARRSVVGALTEEIRVRPAGERLTRWSSDEDRLRLAAERTTIRWHGEIRHA